MTARPEVSVLLCTHNPRADYLNAAMSALCRQQKTDDAPQLEFIVIDNASEPPLLQRTEINFPESARIVVEPKLGLTHARRRSFFESRGEFLIYIDDDNLLEPDYVASACRIMRDDKSLGATGGRVLPRYEVDPPPWFAESGISLACRDLGPDVIKASWGGRPAEARAYPECAPIGAGMVLRRGAYEAYVEATATDPARLALGRRGQDLASGEDNDMVMTMLRHGWSVSYCPELVLTHLIPATRLSLDYLRRYAHSSSRTWVQVLGVHGIRPWSAIPPATVPLRKARAYLQARPWRGPVEQIVWSGACGLIEGRAQLAAAGAA